MEFGCKVEGGRLAVCGGNICYKATRGSCLHVWPCISKAGWDSFPWTKHRPWHAQEEAMLNHSSDASRKEQQYPLESHKHSLCVWCANTDTQADADLLSSTFPCLRPRKKHLNTVIWLSWLQQQGSASRCTAAPPNTTHPPLAICIWQLF